MPNEAPTCHYCKRRAKLVNSSMIYAGVSYGYSWQCPNCKDVYVGCHRGTTKPLGILANRALRIAKTRAHEVFDPIWRTNLVTRTEAYAILAIRLGMDSDACHIGMFDLDQCLRVIDVCPDILEELRDEAEEEKHAHLHGA